MEIIRNRPMLKEKLSQTVSCHYAPPLPHAALSFRAQRSGAEKSPAEQFPVAMLHHYPMPNRKLFANSFLPPCSTNAPRRTGNFSPIVSCRHAPPMPHAGQETIRKQFPAAMLLHCFMLDEKLSSNSFLPPCSTTVPRRMGNYPPTVSCHYAPPLPHAKQETIRQ